MFTSIPTVRDLFDNYEFTRSFSNYKSKILQVCKTPIINSLFNKGICCTWIYFFKHVSYCIVFFFPINRKVRVIWFTIEIHLDMIIVSSVAVCEKFIEFSISCKKNIMMTWFWCAIRCIYFKHFSNRITFIILCIISEYILCSLIR